MSRFEIANFKSQIERKELEKIVGQKVHPYGFRLGYNKDWHSHWFAKKQYGEYLLEDLRLKRDLKNRFAGAGVSHVDIERAANRLKIIIYTSRPGIIIGRKGAEIDKLKTDLSAKTGREVLVSIQEIHKPELNAQLQAEKIAAQLEKRIAFRRAMRKAVEESLRFGAQGIKVKVSGRLPSEPPPPSRSRRVRGLRSRSPIRVSLIGSEPVPRAIAAFASRISPR